MSNMKGYRISAKPYRKMLLEIAAHFESFNDMYRKNDFGVSSTGLFYIFKGRSATCTETTASKIERVYKQYKGVEVKPFKRKKQKAGGELRPLEVGENYELSIKERREVKLEPVSVVGEYEHFYLVKVRGGFKTTVLKNDLRTKTYKVKKIS